MQNRFGYHMPWSCLNYLLFLCVEIKICDISVFYSSLLTRPWKFGQSRTPFFFFLLFVLFCFTSYDRRRGKEAGRWRAPWVGPPGRWHTRLCCLPSKCPLFCTRNVNKIDVIANSERKLDMCRVHMTVPTSCHLSAFSRLLLNSISCNFHNT